MKCKYCGDKIPTRKLTTGVSYQQAKRICVRCLGLSEKKRQELKKSKRRKYTKGAFGYRIYEKVKSK